MFINCSGTSTRIEAYQWILFNLIENNVLGSMAAVATIITVFVSAYKHFKDKNNEKMRVSQNLYLELGDTLRSMDYYKSPEDFGRVDVQGRAEKKTLYFMSKSLNHDFYDSLISSGRINFLEPDLQQPIQNIFKRIKMHNEFLTITKRMQDRQTDGSVPKQAYQYYEWMDEHEVYLSREIPNMMKKLQQYFKFDRRVKV